MKILKCIFKSTSGLPRIAANLAAVILVLTPLVYSTMTLGKSKHDRTIIKKPGPCDFDPKNASENKLDNCCSAAAGKCMSMANEALNGNDFGVALALYERACNAPRPDRFACGSAGFSADKMGKTDLAKNYFQLSCQYGNEEGCVNRAVLATREKNDEDYLKFTKEACTTGKGNGESCLSAALLISNGPMPTSKNHSLVHTYIDRACVLGVKDTCPMRDDILGRMKKFCGEGREFESPEGEDPSSIGHFLIYQCKVNGTLDGNYVLWDSKMQPKAGGVYKTGEKIGNWSYFDEKEKETVETERQRAVASVEDMVCRCQQYEKSLTSQLSRERRIASTTGVVNKSALYQVGSQLETIRGYSKSLKKQLGRAASCKRNLSDEEKVECLYQAAGHPSE